MSSRYSPGQRLILAGAILLAMIWLLILPLEEADLSERESSPPRAATEPAPPISPSESDASRIALRDTPPHADADGAGSPAEPGEASRDQDGSEEEAAIGSLDWVRERYQESRERRRTIREGATRKHRKLNIEELARSWAIEFELQEAIGAAAYDRLIYDLGRKNRVRVNWVASGSNADRAGIIRNDIILGYDDHPEYALQGIRERNKLLDEGSWITIRYERDGEVFQTKIATDKYRPVRGGPVNGMTLIPFARRPQ